MVQAAWVGSAEWSGARGTAPRLLYALRPHGSTHPSGLLLFAVLLVTALSVAVLVLWRRVRAYASDALRERALREEVEAYARLDSSLAPGRDPKAMALRVCRTVAEKSAFRRVALLVRDAEGKLSVAASAGVDDLTAAALRSWGEAAARPGFRPPLQNHVQNYVHADFPMGSRPVPLTDPSGNASFVIALDGHASGPRPLTVRRAILTPLRVGSGAMLGALAVCPDDLGSIADSAFLHALAPLEALSVKLARCLENAMLAERLLRAEKLAGLGQLAGGVAHELNNPLTAILGFAELIAEVSNDRRVREDAATITHEARRMKETVESLLNFWRPVTPQDTPVDIRALLAELTAGCSTELAARGVLLVVEAAQLPPVRGNRDRLRQVLEHLLNNAAQAIARGRERRGKAPTALPRGADEGDRCPAIRIAVSHYQSTLHLIVSDTGPGFDEPTRAFDPFYTTRQPGSGRGMGLSICYGIVREHGGEISAFNLHPHGAAVVIELPLVSTVAEQEDEDRQREITQAGVRWRSQGCLLEDVHGDFR